MGEKDPSDSEPTKTCDYICCVCGDKATNYRSVGIKQETVFFRYFSGFMGPLQSATLAEFSSGEL